jgi:membrane-bound ClpP family serine protease
MASDDPANANQPPPLSAESSEVESPENASNEGVSAYLVRVPTPIVGEVDTRIKSMVDQLLVRWEGTTERPILILEFGGDAGEASRSSEFERALSLARYIAGERLNRVRTIAYLTGTVQGHAVLPVLACEEIVADPDAEFGLAGVAERFIDATIRGGYTEIAERRRTVPVPVVLAMLEPQLAVYQVQTQQGTRYVAQDELAELKEQASVRSVQRVVPDGEMANFTGSDLRLKFGFASHLIRDRMDLADTLRLPAGSIQQDPTLSRDRRAVRIDVTGLIRPDVVTWVERSLRDKIENQGVNFVVVNIDSPGGSPSDSVRLAMYLADLDPSQVRTVAFVESEARGDAALIALACDQLVMTDEAVLGGPGARRIGPKQAEHMQTPIREIGKAKKRGWSLPAALVDPDLTVRSYTRQAGGGVRYFCDEELAEQDAPQQWQAGEDLATGAGLNGREAVRAGISHFAAADWDDLCGVYRLDDLESVRPNWANSVIEFLATPKVAGALLFVGWFALMIEFASPGLSFAGFTSAVCFVLYFWVHFLQGTAGWLEVLLFTTGVMCVALEVFAIPGLGAFGIGGGALIIASIILATQTYVIPRNTYEWNQLPSSLFMVVAAVAGAFAPLVFMRRLLTEAPLFRRVSLTAPDEECLEKIRQQESMVHLEHLAGKRGVTTTQLTPSGKARFGDEIVDVMTGGDVIPRGVDVYVARVTGSEIVVRPIG